MFVGHIALGLAAKRVTPRVSLAVLIGAAQLADMLWPLLVALGVETVRIDPGNTAFTPLDFVSYPYSHSLVTLIVWGIVLGAVYRAITRENGRAFVVLAALVVSHWVLDWITHRPDMPIYPGGPTYGLGLWNNVRMTLFVEGAMWAVGIWIYMRATRARDGIGRWAFISLIALLSAFFFGDAPSTPPPSVNVLVVSAFVAIVVLTAWSWWADRHREGILTPTSNKWSQP
jgi:hypothetical protein